jgi:uncharacterized membrane protein
VIRRRGEKGLALLTFALALTLLVPILGVGIDTAMLYVTKERLNSAVQLSARAAKKSAQNPEAAALRTFRANFPPGFLGTGSSQASYNAKDGSVHASIAAPTFFMRMFRKDSVTVEATATVPTSPS